MSVFNFLIYKLTKLTLKVRNLLTNFFAIEEAQKSAELWKKEKDRQKGIQKDRQEGKKEDRHLQKMFKFCLTSCGIHYVL